MTVSPDVVTRTSVHVPHCNSRCIADSHWLTADDDDQHAHDTAQRPFCEACRDHPVSP